MEKSKVIRVALRKPERGFGKELPSELFCKEVGINPRMGGTVVNKQLMGREGLMLEEDFESKNFAPYGLSEKDITKELKNKSLMDENNKLQNASIEKDSIIEELKRQLEELKNQPEPIAEEEKKVKKSNNK